MTFTNPDSLDIPISHLMRWMDTTMQAAPHGQADGWLTAIWVTVIVYTVIVVLLTWGVITLVKHL